MSLRNAVVALAFLIAFFAGGGYPSAQARAIPWDCSDWQAFAHEDRTTAILESLAENRGKTLYCGVDQSDTFSKAETWQAGKDRNERDDTVYFGERGQFRGFIAAQEGWLTDGESGVTGVSIDRIFEFPREKRRVKRVKRLNISGQSDSTVRESCHSAAANPGDLLCSARGAAGSATGQAGAEVGARNNQLGYLSTTTNWGQTGGTARIDWETHRVDYWQELADEVAGAACRERGYRLARAVFGPGHDNRKGAGAWRQGDDLGWFYTDDQDGGAIHQYQAWQSRTWTATCKKTIRRSRR